MRIALFTYDFPHGKSTDVFCALRDHGFEVPLVIAAPRKELSIPQPRIRTRVCSPVLSRPGKFRQPVRGPEGKFTQQDYTDFGAVVCTLPHDSRSIRSLVERYGIDLGVIGGARIVPRATIDAFPGGILNLHPGILPENRGLQTLHYAVYKQLPMGVTAHLIDERVDAGHYVTSEEVPVYRGDSWDDVAFRLYRAQLDLLPRALALIRMRCKTPALATDEPVNTPGDPAVDDYLEKHWNDYITAFGREGAA